MMTIFPLQPSFCEHTMGFQIAAEYVIGSHFGGHFLRVQPGIGDDHGNVRRLGFLDDLDVGLEIHRIDDDGVALRVDGQLRLIVLHGGIVAAIVEGNICQAAGYGRVLPAITLHQLDEFRLVAIHQDGDSYFFRDGSHAWTQARSHQEC